MRRRSKTKKKKISFIIGCNLCLTKQRKQDKYLDACVHLCAQWARDERGEFNSRRLLFLIFVAVRVIQHDEEKNIRQTLTNSTFSPLPMFISIERQKKWAEMRFEDNWWSAASTINQKSIRFSTDSANRWTTAHRKVINLDTFKSAKCVFFSVLKMTWKWFSHQKNEMRESNSLFNSKSSRKWFCVAHQECFIIFWCFHFWFGRSAKSNIIFDAFLLLLSLFRKEITCCFCFKSKFIANRIETIFFIILNSTPASVEIKRAHFSSFSR